MTGAALAIRSALEETPFSRIGIGPRLMTTESPGYLMSTDEDHPDRWCNPRPGFLTNGPLTRSYRVLTDLRGKPRC